MKHSVRSLSWVALAAALLATAACGGKSSATPKGPGPADPNAAPFDQAKVKAALAATPQSSAPPCGDPANVSTTLGELFKAQGDALAPSDADFVCRPDMADDGTWECTWSVFAKPGAADAEDPCSGGSAGFQIIAKVGADGVLVENGIICNAPG